MGLTVHHLQISQSERCVFLCEELGLDYTLKNYPRSPMLAPPEYKALHPLGQSPVIQDPDRQVTLAESAACCEYIDAVHGHGQLSIPPGQPGYEAYLYWFHFVNGTLQPGLILQMTLQMSGAGSDSPIAQMFEQRSAQAYQHLDAHLGGTGPWLAGEKFTLADIMIMTTLTTMRMFSGRDFSAYGNVLAYVKRVSEREGYQRAMKKGDPELDVQELIAGPAPPAFKPKTG